MKYLILGAKGNLGTAFMNTLTTRTEDRVFGWDSSEIDITDFDVLTKKISTLKPDVIINTVAYNNVDECESEEGYERARLLNIDTVRVLGEIALETEALLISYSSDYVFAGDNSDGYDEEAVPNPISRYGETKVEGEKELIRLSGRGLRWYLIRTSKLFGPPATGPSAKPNFFDLMRVQLDKQEVRAIDSEESSFTYTPDLVQATLALIEDEAAFGIYHLTNSGSATWYEAALFLFKTLGATTVVTPVPPETFPRPAKRPATSVLHNTKRPALRPWQEAVEEFVTTLSV